MNVAASARTAKLVMVSPANNNKFYDMVELDGGEFEVRYGRVGARPSVRRYPLALWGRKYAEKVRKGYRDVTPLRAEVPAEADYLADDPAVQALLRDLKRDAHRAIQAQYLVSAGEVTPQQVEEAQTLIDRVAALVRRGADPDPINERLLALFTVIPRRMHRVQDHLVETLDTAEQLASARARLAEEQATLDVMAGQVRARAAAEATSSRRPSLLEALGLIVIPATDEQDVDRIKTQMDEAAGLCRRIFAVTNVRTQQAFEAHLRQAPDPTTALLWHGSRNENWLSILESGLVLRPANATINGKMFGEGLYFADRCRKSLNYTSLRGAFWTGGTAGRAYLALYEVHRGRALTIKRHDPSCYDLCADRLVRRRGLRRERFDSVFAQGGVDLMNNEYIVYRPEQCTVRYLVELAA